MGNLNEYKPNQVELLTDTLDEKQWWQAITEIVEFLKLEGASQVELKYGFILDRDIDGLPQGQDTVIPLSNLLQVISSSLQEGTIERIGESDFVVIPDIDLMFMLCNDGDIHISSTDRSYVMLLGVKLKTSGFVIYDDGKKI